MSNVIHLHGSRSVFGNTLRSECEHLMRRLVKDGRTPEHELRILANVLDHIITQTEMPRG